jgi:hypothetical protein
VKTSNCFKAHHQVQRITAYAVSVVQGEVITLEKLAQTGNQTK